MSKTGEIYLSRRQNETLTKFFSGNYDEILYGGGARGGKSFLIGVILAIGVSSMPGSSWLVSRTVLSELHSTTMLTFYEVLKMFGFGSNSYRDRIREKKYLEFNNGSKVFVIQTPNQPSDPEFDNLGSLSFTGSFLDEAQQMVTKVRSVLRSRYSQTSGVITFNVDKRKGFMPVDEDIGYKIRIGIVEKASYNKEELEELGYSNIVKNGKYFLAIEGYNELFIPYTVIDKEDLGDSILYSCVWKFSACSLLSCNPGKNFTYSDFYVPFRDNKLPKRMDFIRALVTDNPFVDREYIEILERSEDKITKERLLYGNFEYDDDETLLFNIDLVNNLYTDTNININGEYYITCDAARKGKDFTVIMVWRGFTVIDIITIKDGKLTTQSENILELSRRYNISIDNIIVDEIGVGGGIVDILGCKGFIANSSAVHPISSKLLSYKKRNYLNLRTQAYFYLLQYMKEGKVKIIDIDESTKELLNSELLYIRQKNIDGDTKIQLQSKGDLKWLLGRSPDYSDCLSFRFYWVIKGLYEYEEEEEEETDYNLVDRLEAEEEEDANRYIYKGLEVDIY